MTRALEHTARFSLDLAEGIRQVLRYVVFALALASMFGGCPGPKHQPAGFTFVLDKGDLLLRADHPERQTRSAGEALAARAAAPLTSDANT